MANSHILGHIFSKQKNKNKTVEQSKSKNYVLTMCYVMTILISAEITDRTDIHIMVRNSEKVNFA